MAMNSFHARNSKPQRHDLKPTPAEARAGTRADLRLVLLGLADSRSAAQRLIACGRVQWRSGGGLKTLIKASEILPDNAELLVGDDTNSP